MFVQALAQFADTNEELQDALNNVAWEQKPVPYLLELAQDGSFLGAVERKMPVIRGKKTISLPQPLTVARSPVNRNSGHHPLLAADDIAYVLGIGSWTGTRDEDKHARHHEAFLALIQKAAEATHDEGLHACERFYGNPDQVDRARAELKEVKADLGSSFCRGPCGFAPRGQALLDLALQRCLRGARWQRSW